MQDATTQQGPSIHLSAALQGWLTQPVLRIPSSAQTRVPLTRQVAIIHFSARELGKERLQAMPTRSSDRAQENKIRRAERMFSSVRIQGFPIRRASPILSSGVRLVPSLLVAALIRSSDAQLVLTTTRATTLSSARAPA